MEGGQPQPARAYTLRTIALPGSGQHSHLLVLQAGAGEYQVMACSAPSLGADPDCTLSGVGAINGELAGDAHLMPAGTVGTFVVNLTPFLVPALP